VVLSSLIPDETKFEHPFARVLLFAPVGAEPTFKQFMMDDGISPGTRRMPDVSHDLPAVMPFHSCTWCADKWLMLPMIDDNVVNPDLGAKLQAALQRLRSDGFGDGTQLSFSIYSIHQLPKLNLCTICRLHSHFRRERCT